MKSENLSTMALPDTNPLTGRNGEVHCGPVAGGDAQVGGDGGMDTAGIGTHISGGCPKCGLSFERSFVLDSRPNGIGKRRRRKCSCGERYSTIEMTVEDHVKQINVAVALMRMEELHRQTGELIERMKVIS